MIKMTAGNMILLGLTDKNMEKLALGKPIFFNLKELNFPDVPVLIVDENAPKKIMTEIAEGVKRSGADLLMIIGVNKKSRFPYYAKVAHAGLDLMIVVFRGATEQAIFQEYKEFMHPTKTVIVDERAAKNN